MSGIPYKIHVRKRDFELEVQGDKDWVEEKYKALMAEETASTPITLKSETATIPATLGEFVDQKGNPSKHTDLITVFAYWLFNVETIESFNMKDILACYIKTRRSKPSNINQIINANVMNSRFSEANQPKEGYKAWILTRTGEDFVEKMR